LAYCNALARLLRHELREDVKANRTRSKNDAEPPQFLRTMSSPNSWVVKLDRRLEFLRQKAVILVGFNRRELIGPQYRLPYEPIILPYEPIIKNLE
jgi:hypothetical protein